MRRAALPWLLVVAAACSPKLEVPPGAQITCARDGDCPAGWVCGSSGRCESAAIPVPTSSPHLGLPDGQTAVKNGDVLKITGTSDAGAAIDSLRLVNLADGSTAEALAPATLVIDASGHYTGTAVATGLVDGTSVALEVVVRAGGKTSLPAKSRDLPVTVDLTPPKAASINFGIQTVFNDPHQSPQLGAIEASEVYLDGDLADGADARAWYPFPRTGAWNVVFTAADGDKVVTARFRDGAHNEASASITVKLTNGRPTVAPQLFGPSGAPTRTRSAGVVTVGGSTNGAEAVSAAWIVVRDPSGTDVCTKDVYALVTLDAGHAPQGTINLNDIGAAACVTAPGVGWQVLLRMVVGTTGSPSSIPTDSAPLDVDDVAPAGLGAALAAANAEPGFTGTVDVVLHVDATSDGTQFTVSVAGDLGTAFAPTSLGGASPAPGATVQADLPVQVSAGDGAKNLTVTVTDAVGNASSALTAITLLTTAPAAPSAASLRLVETSPAPLDPARTDPANDVFTLTGLTGALVGGAQLQIYRDAGLTSPLLSPPGGVNADGSFGAQQFSLASGLSCWVVNIGKTHLPSAPTKVSLPNLAFTSPAPGVYTSGQTLFITFTTDQDLVNPVVKVDALAATFQSYTAAVPGPGGTYRFTYGVTGAEPSGVSSAVVRVQAQDGSGRYAGGTTVTRALALGFDSTPPAVAAAKVVVTSNDPGTPDSIVGLAGAVSDDVSPAGSVALIVANGSPPGQTLFSGFANADGSFGPISLGDNAVAGVAITVTDQVGLVGSFAFANDITPPATGPVAITPTAATAGQTATLDFNVSDDLHDLRALPVVTVGGRPTTYVSGTTGTSDKLAHPFRHTYAVQATDPEGPAGVSVHLVDAVGNAKDWLQGWLLIDHSPPVTSNSDPGAQDPWSGRPAIRGTVADAWSDILGVAVSIEDVAAGKWWNGVAFSATVETWGSANVTPTGNHTASWSYATNGIPFVDGQTYLLRYRASDVVGNLEVPGAGKSFTFQHTLPPPPSALSATSVGAARIDLAWTQAAVPPAHYRLYYDVAAGPHPPWAGTGLSTSTLPSCDSPCDLPPGVTSSLSIGGLAAGSFTFALTAIDAGGYESLPSNQATATLRRWQWKSPGLTTNTMRAVAPLFSGTLVAVGDAGTGWRSTDGGATWSGAFLGQTAQFDTIWTSGGVVVALGGPGAISRSADDGRTWQAVFSPNAVVTYTSVAGVNASTAVAVGYNGYNGIIVRSTDAGQTWTQPVFPGPANQGFNAVWASGNTVVAVGDGGLVYRSTDGGATWTSLTGVTTKTLRAVAGTAATLVAVGDQVALRSVDGGATWAAASGIAPSLTSLYGTASAFVAGHGAGALVSADGGQTWTAATAPSGGAWSGVVALSGQGLVVAAGLDNATLLRSGDGGATWARVLAPPANPLVYRALAIASPAAVAVGDGGARAVSGDTAQTWAVQAVAAPPLSLVTGSGSAVVALGSGADALYSADGGDTWARATTPHFGYRAIWGSGTSFVAVGTNQFISRSANGGATWSSSSSGPGPVLYDVCGAGSTVVAVGGGGTILRSTDGGATFGSIASGTADQLTRLWCTPALMAAVGAGGTVLVSTSGGASWAPATTNPVPSTQNLTQVWGDGAVLVATGGNNSAWNLRSTNSGVDWSSPLSGLGASDWILKLWGSGSTFVGGGLNGLVYRSTDDGLTWVETGANYVYGSASVLGGAGSFAVLATTLSELRQTDDAGASWTVPPVDSYVPAPPTDGFSAVFVRAANDAILVTPGGGVLRYGPP